MVVSAVWTEASYGEHVVQSIRGHQPATNNPQLTTGYHPQNESPLLLMLKSGGDHSKKPKNGGGPNRTKSSKQLQRLSLGGTN